MQDASIPTEMDELEAFFGCPLQKVEHQVLSLARALNRPDWLRGKTKRQQLPRHGKLRNSIYHTHAVNLIGVDNQERAERIEWIIDNLSGDWCFEVYGIWFNKQSDLIHYRLRYAGDDPAPV